MPTENKLYKALVSFEHDGLSYEAGTVYELSDELVSTLPEGNVEGFTPPEVPETSAPVEPEAELPAGEPTPKPEAEKPASAQTKAWVGNHKV